MSDLVERLIQTANFDADSDAIANLLREAAQEINSLNAREFGYESAIGKLGGLVDEVRADRDALHEALRGMLAIQDSVTQGQERELRAEWLPKARKILAALKETK